MTLRQPRTTTFVGPPRAGVNHFSDLSHAEFIARYTSGLRVPDAAARRRAGESISPPAFRGSEAVPAGRSLPAATVLPESKDWVAAGAVTPVRDQGDCGSCWTFSAAGALEGLRFLQTGRSEWLSLQQLVDCDYDPTGRGNQGCGGGDQGLAFSWIRRNGGA